MATRFPTTACSPDWVTVGTRKMNGQRCSSKESFERVTEKIVRGIYYIEDSVFIEPPHSIEFHALPEDGFTPWKDALDRCGITYARGSAVLVGG